MKHAIINSLMADAPTPELQKMLEDRIDLYNSALNGDTEALILVSSEFGMCTPEEAQDFITTYMR